MTAIDAPFPWFGGKRRCAPEVWARFGAVANFVEPFFGSGAVLLGRPGSDYGTETINDLDGFVANFWRAVQAAPEEVAEYADQPVNENDLHARHSWLVERRPDLQSRLEGDPDYYDARIAGWWVWGLCCWIGGGWCSGVGPWQAVDGKLVNLGNAGQGVMRRRPHLGNAGRGVKRQRPHLGNAGQGVMRQLPHLGNAGQGVTRRLPHLGTAGRGVKRRRPHLGTAGQGRLVPWFAALADRLRGVRVCSGDWSRVLGPSVTDGSHGLTGVFLDPPYSLETNRDMDCYAIDSGTVAHSVAEWALANGDRPTMRIALCGYEDEHVMPESWPVHAWKAHSGYASQGDGGNANARRERIWFSPHCLGQRQGRLFT